MIKNVIFDIGEVLVDFRWFDLLKEKGFSEELAERIVKATSKSKTWREFDRGHLTYSEVVDSFCSDSPELGKEIRLAFENLAGIVRLRPYAIPLIKKLKSRGMGVYYLSNWFKKICDDCPDALEFLPYTDGGIFSWQEGVVKPDYEIYRRLLAKYGLKAEECIFIDDNSQNVAAAKELGFAGAVFEDAGQIEAVLDGLSFAE